MARVGYARVSTTGQSLEVQLAALHAAGCDKIYSEKVSGLDAARPELRACLDYVRDSDDTLIVTRLDRLARSTLDLHRIIDGLNRKGVGFMATDQAFNTTTSEGRLMFGILATIAQFETELRAERQREGIERAKREGVRWGRKPKVTPQQIETMKNERDQGALIRDLMDKYKLSKASVYRCLNA
jgi:DNA invertase Pin-like site-specific DNA recombinase